MGDGGRDGESREGREGRGIGWGAFGGDSSSGEEAHLAGQGGQGARLGIGAVEQAQAGARVGSEFWPRPGVEHRENREHREHLSPRTSRFDGRPGTARSPSNGGGIGTSPLFSGGGGSGSGVGPGGGSRRGAGGSPFMPTGSAGSASRGEAKEGYGFLGSRNGGSLPPHPRDSPSRHNRTAGLGVGVGVGAGLGTHFPGTSAEGDSGAGRGTSAGVGVGVSAGGRDLSARELLQAYFLKLHAHLSAVVMLELGEAALPEATVVRLVARLLDGIARRTAEAGSTEEMGVEAEGAVGGVDGEPLLWFAPQWGAQAQAQEAEGQEKVGKVGHGEREGGDCRALLFSAFDLLDVDGDGVLSETDFLPPQEDLGSGSGVDVGVGREGDVALQEVLQLVLGDLTNNSNTNSNSSGDSGDTGDCFFRSSGAPALALTTPPHLHPSPSIPRAEQAQSLACLVGSVGAALALPWEAALLLLARHGWDLHCAANAHYSAHYDTKSLNAPYGRTGPYGHGHCGYSGDSGSFPLSFVRLSQSPSDMLLRSRVGAAGPGPGVGPGAGSTSALQRLSYVCPQCQTLCAPQSLVSLHCRHFACLGCWAKHAEEAVARGLPCLPCLCAVPSSASSSSAGSASASATCGCAHRGGSDLVLLAGGRPLLLRHLALRVSVLLASYQNRGGGSAQDAALLRVLLCRNPASLEGGDIGVGTGTGGAVGTGPAAGVGDGLASRYSSPPRLLHRASSPRPGDVGVKLSGSSLKAARHQYAPGWATEQSEGHVLKYLLESRAFMASRGGELEGEMGRASGGLAVLVCSRDLLDQYLRAVALLQMLEGHCSAAAAAGAGAGGGVLGAAPGTPGALYGGMGVGGMGGICGIGCMGGMGGMGAMGAGGGVGRGVCVLQGVGADLLDLLRDALIVTHVNMKNRWATPHTPTSTPSTEALTPRVARESQHVLRLLMRKVAECAGPFALPASASASAPMPLGEPSASAGWAESDEAEVDVEVEVEFPGADGGTAAVSVGVGVGVGPSRTYALSDVLVPHPPFWPAFGAPLRPEDLQLRLGGGRGGGGGGEGQTEGLGLLEAQELGQGQGQGREGRWGSDGLQECTALIESLRRGHAHLPPHSLLHELQHLDALADAGYQSVLYAHDACPALLAVLARPEAPLCLQALLTLDKLCDLNDPCCREIAPQLSTICSLLRVHGGDAGVCLAACKVLTNVLSSSEEAKRACLMDGAFAALRQMLAHRQEVVAQAVVQTLVCGLDKFAHDSTFVRLGLCELLLERLVQLRHLPGMRVQYCIAVGRLASSNPFMQERLLHLTVFEQLIDILRHARDAKLTKWAAWAVGAMAAKYAPGQLRFVALGGCRVLSQALQVTDVNALTYVLRTVAYLCAHNKQVRDCFQTEGVAEQLRRKKGELCALSQESESYDLKSKLNLLFLTCDYALDAVGAGMGMGGMGGGVGMGMGGGVGIGIEVGLGLGVGLRDGAMHDAAEETQEQEQQGGDEGEAEQRL
ncbi:hypothetical protein B484DRAFT_108632 [Ochromonadaceae sp. CCMP2298]|nr:hypothetical protein B484DRAFT_108632 [Ochromonadaceae sp. CCMP2298]